jgi:hypothetical protein
MNSPVVISGNSVIEPNECNSVNISLTNSGDVQATTGKRRLTSTTPGVTIQPLINPYPNIGANGDSQISLAPFQNLDSRFGSLPDQHRSNAHVVYSERRRRRLSILRYRLEHPQTRCTDFHQVEVGRSPQQAAWCTGSAVDDAL